MQAHKSERRTLPIELEVNNHPGVMSHVCGLFSRRAFNMEGILCLPSKRVPGMSRIWLLVHDDARLGQLMRELEKLYDVRSVRRHGAGHDAFERLEAMFAEAKASQQTNVR